MCLTQDAILLHCFGATLYVLEHKDEPDTDAAPRGSGPSILKGDEPREERDLLSLLTPVFSTLHSTQDVAGAHEGFHGRGCTRGVKPESLFAERTASGKSTSGPKNGVCKDLATGRFRKRQEGITLTITD